MSVKHDSGKIRPSLVILSMSRALQAVSEVGTFGAEKYTDDGWREVPDGVRRYTDAMLRHQLAEASGEVNDPESGLPHAAHIAWNALARLDLMLRVEQCLAAHIPHEGQRRREAVEQPEPISDGWYDNRKSCVREAWRDGAMVAFLTEHQVRSQAVQPPFGTYPDVPRT